MGSVQRLSEALTNQIAAGEVVERPASAVKELVENALDAGAKRIEIRLEDGGRKRIDIIDDGVGMSREDALLSLERHTTSKLHSADDLFNIHTFGFRGEALPSISSVSRFVLTTRRAVDIAATRIEIEGGKVVSVTEVGSPPGTRVEVCDLFFNVPARLKFLKRRETEVGHISDWVTRLALANTAVGFNVDQDDRSLLRADPTGDLRERIAAVLGRDIYKALYPVDGGVADVKVTGFAAGPAHTNNTSREIFTFVNGRFIRDRGLLHAVGRAYEGVLPVGRNPACVLFLQVPPDRVDVNVHPQKLEVRFVDQRPVYDAIAKSVAWTLSGSPWLPKAETRTYTLGPAVDGAPPPGLTPQQERVADAIERFGERNPKVPLSEALFARSAPAPDQPLRAADSAVAPPAPLAWSSPAPATPSAESREQDRTLTFGELRYLGQLHRTYLACESPEGLLLLDQHAAHERVLYERYKAARSGVTVTGQPFLVPVSMDLSASDARMVEAAREELLELGFEIEPFGGSTFTLKAAPAELKGGDLPRIVRELAVEVRALGRGLASEALEESVLARMACHNAVRAGHALTSQEAETLLRSLDGVPFNAQCPHGRPVVVMFDVESLKEMFGRTYEGTSRASARERIER